MITLKEKQRGYTAIENVINKNITHAHYQRTIDIAVEYFNAITGENIKPWLQRYKRRETQEDFDERIDMTSKVFVSALSNVLKKFNKLTSIKDITKNVSFVSGDTDRQAKIDSLNQAEKDLVGSSFEEFVRDYLLPKSHRDPNSFIAIFFSTVNKTKVPYFKHHPAKECVYFEYEKENTLDFLITKEEVLAVKGNGESGNFKDFTIYGGEVVIQYKSFINSSDVDKDNREQFSRKITPSDSTWKDISGNLYYVYEYKMLAKDLQVFRLGYQLDPMTDETTCVSIFESAMPVIKRLVTVLSQHDVSRNTHTFPRLLTYIGKCSYSSEEEGDCTDGYLGNGEKCPSCKGTGKKKVETEQDTMEIKFPDNLEDVFDINKLASYVNQSTNIVEFLDRLEQRLERRIFAAVFNSEMTPHSALSAVGDTVTATEVTTTRSDINDTLILTASFISRIKKWIYSINNSYIYPKSDDKLIVVYEYPNDLKLSSIEELLAQMKQAKEANAPHFILEELSMGIARKMYDGDEISSKKISLKKKFIPFFEKDYNFVVGGLDKGLISEEDAIVYFNQETIFVDIEQENKNIYFLKSDEQKKIVDKFISQYLIKFKPKDNGKSSDNQKI